MSEHSESKISEERCIEIGGHCWRINNQSISREPGAIHTRSCRHCGHKQIGRSQPSVLWEDRKDETTIGNATYKCKVESYIYTEWRPAANEYTVIKPAIFPLTEEDCIGIGGHCYEQSFWLSYPDKPLNRWCKHCGHEQVGIKQPEIIWEDVEEKEIP